MEIPKKTFTEYLDEKRNSKNSKGFKDNEIEKHWQERIVPQELDKAGRLGVQKYLRKYGANISSDKCIRLARKAEDEKCYEFAAGFWESAYFIDTNKQANQSEYKPPKADTIESEFITESQSTIIPVPVELAEISEQVKNGKKTSKETVRTFLSWFKVTRRNRSNLEVVNTALQNLGLKTSPDYKYHYIDGSIEFLPAYPQTEDSVTNTAQSEGENPVIRKEAIENPLLINIVNDPTYRIGRLASANKVPTSVKSDEKIEKATFLMINHNFSQLPVMDSESKVRGIISWTTIGQKLALGKPLIYVKDCIDQHHEISEDTSLFSAIEKIIRYEYVLIRDSKNKICGIVTTSDLSQQFTQLTEPFLLLGEIENYIRRLLKDKFTVAELASMKNPSDKKRQINGVFDLTFGEYIRLLQEPNNWSKLNLLLDRNVFITYLDNIRAIRNDVMHFDPDGTPNADLEKLRNFVHLLQTLTKRGAV